MPLAEFVNSAVEYQLELESLGAQAADAVRGEFLRLLETPEDRNEAIHDWFITGGYESTLEETGNEELAFALWETVDELASMRFSELAQQPVGSRGQTWGLAASVMLAAAQQQALITHGPVVPAMALGARAGEDLSREMRGVSAADLRSISDTGIGPELKRRKRENKANQRQDSGRA
jgi:hypothetical protein